MALEEMLFENVDNGYLPILKAHLQYEHSAQVS